MTNTFQAQLNSLNDKQREELSNIGATFDECHILRREGDLIILKPDSFIPAPVDLPLDKATLEVSINGDMLFGAYPNQIVQIVWDTQRLEAAAQILERHLNYLNEVIAKRNNSSMEAETGEDPKES